MARWQIFYHFIQQLCALQVGHRLQAAHAEVFAVVLYHIIAERVKGIYVHLMCCRAYDLHQPAAHGIGRFIGIGKAQYFMWLHLRFAAHQVGNTHGEHLCFTRSRSGYYHYGAIDSVHSFALPFVQFIISL